MRVVQILTVSSLAILAGGLSVLAHRFDQLYLVVAALSAAFVAGLLVVTLRLAGARQELGLLRTHLESTRQHAALLARHTRELRDSLALTPREGRAEGEGGASAEEFATLSGLVRDIANSLAEIDRRAEAVEGEIADLRRAGTAVSARPAAAPPGWVSSPKPIASPAPVLSAAPVSAPQPTPRAEPTFSFESEVLAPQALAGEAPEPSRAVRQHVAAAIAADRFDLFLQRIVTLPQRRTRAYDLTLRPDGVGLNVTNGEIRASVEAVGHQLAFDRKLMIQAVRLARVFLQRDRDVLLVVDISQRFLMSDAAFEELEALLVDVPRAAERIVLSLPQRFFAKAVAFENEALRRLARMGFVLMMRDVSDLSLDLNKFARFNVRWLRMASGAFLATAHRHDTLMEVASTDFVALLARNKISVIADQVGEEAEIAELIDLGVEYAHGPAFAPPQAVRPDVLDGPAAPAREPAAPAGGERRGLRDLAKRA